MRKAQARGSFEELAGKDSRGHPSPQQRGSKSADASSDTCKFQNRKEKYYHCTQYLSFYAMACSTSVSLSYSSKLSQFSYAVFKIKSSTLTSPDRESCPPTAAETFGKQQPMLPARFFGLSLVRGPTLLPGFCSPLKFQCSKQYSIGLYIPVQQGAPSIMPLLVVILHISP